MHPFAAAKYCMRCGAPGESSRGRFACTACGFRDRLHPRPCAAALPVRDSHILLVRRDIEPRRGYWQVPGGFMEAGESPQEAARRELREEACIEAGAMRLLAVHTPVSVALVVITFECEALGPGGAGHEVQEVRWFAPGEVPWGEISFVSSELAIREWLRQRGHAAPPVPLTSFEG